MFVTPATLEPASFHVLIVEPPAVFRTDVYSRQFKEHLTSNAAIGIKRDRVRVWSNTSLIGVNSLGRCRTAVVGVKFVPCRDG